MTSVTAGRLRVRRLDQWRQLCSSVCATVGKLTRVQGGKLLHAAAVLAAVLVAALRPTFWRRTIGNAFAREVLSGQRDWN